MSKKATLLWVDLEMTGLSVEKDRILEVAVVATNWEFEEIAVYESGVKCSRALMKRRMVGEFWERHSEVRDELMDNSVDGRESGEVEDGLMRFVRMYFGEKVYLAGNSIHQDRKFIEKYWPRLDKMLHYRMLDVSAWKVYFEEAQGKRFVKPEMHRATDDIRGSMEELKYYLRNGGYVK